MTEGLHAGTAPLTLVSLVHMHPAAAAFFAMSAQQQRVVHLRLLVEALGIWEAKRPSGVPPTYQETVAGTVQELDIDLPGDAYVSIEAGTDTANVASRYQEPIVALRDGDLKLSESAEFAYYALYNAFRLHVLRQSIDPWVIVNQALSSFPEERWEDLLEQAIKDVGLTLRCSGPRSAAAELERQPFPLTSS